VTVTDVVTPPASFPSLRSEGPPREVGRAHGRAFGDQIAGSISLYRRKFDDIGLDWNRALDLAHRSGDFLRGLDHELAEELDGIAAGAEVDPREILTINIRTAVTRMVEAQSDEDHECTTAAVLPEATADGHTLLAQNWDQRGRCQENTVVIEQHIPGQPALLFVTEAGILFRHGMNDAGIGIAGNALRSPFAPTTQSWCTPTTSPTPRHVSWWRTGASPGRRLSSGTAGCATSSAAG
jgi:isopenicillin-N N-acyltransferase like protein